MDNFVGTASVSDLELDGERVPMAMNTIYETDSFNSSMTSTRSSTLDLSQSSKIRLSSAIPPLNSCEDFALHFGMDEYLRTLMSSMHDHVQSKESSCEKSCEHLQSSFRNARVCVQGQRAVGKALVPSIEDFVIVKNISSGAFGKVVLARHRTKSEQIYAVKVMDKVHMLNKNMAERVNNEKNALAISHSDFVVKIFYSLQSRSRIYLVMEYMIGGDLKNLLQRMIAFPEGAARFYIAECALALEYLHKHGIIHRDIKPDNVLIGVDGHVKLTDFGLCNFDRENVEIGDIIATPMNLRKTKAFRGRTPGQLMSLTADIRLTPEMKHYQRAAETKLEQRDESVSQMLNSGLRRIHISPPAVVDESLPRAPMTPLNDITNFRDTPRVGHSRTAFTTLPRKAHRSAGYKRQSFEYAARENPDEGLRKRPKRENRPKRLSFKLVEDSPPVEERRGENLMERDDSSGVCMFNLSVGGSGSLSPPRASTPQPGFVVEKETCMPNFDLKGSRCASVSSCENLSILVRERHAPLDKLKELKLARQRSVVDIPPRIDEHSVSMSNFHPTTPEPRHRMRLMSKALTEYRPRKKKNLIKSAGHSGILGTPDYLAPEILRKRDHTTAVDIWSLGVCLYEFLIGCPPFIDETVEQVFSNILSRAIDYPEGEESLSEAAVETIESLLETDVSLRPSAVSLRNLPLFKDVDFSAIHRQKAPWIPTTSSDIDTACFDGTRAQFDLGLSSL